MRKNLRVTTRRSVMSQNYVRFAGLILAMFFVGIFYLLAMSNCTQLQKEQGRMNKELNRLEKRYCQEALRWDKMKTPEEIDKALFRRGLQMKSPKEQQIVRVKASGELYPNQLSVQHAQQRKYGAVRRTGVVNLIRR